MAHLFNVCCAHYYATVSMCSAHTSLARHTPQSEGSSDRSIKGEREMRKWETEKRGNKEMNWKMVVKTLSATKAPECM